MWWVAAEIVRSACGSRMTRSASLPGAMVPFRGYRPKILAGMVAVSATKRFRLICSSTTPWKRRVNRSSTPGSPFGIRVKSPRPSSFWPRRNGQWSGVEDRRRVSGGDVPLDEDVDRAAVLGVHRHQHAVLPGCAQHPEDGG